MEKGKRRKSLQPRTAVALFLGAPSFHLRDSNDEIKPCARFMEWDLRIRDVSDSVQLPHAFSAATLRPHLASQRHVSDISDTRRPCFSHCLDVVEAPSMRNLHGKEPGSVGFVHFLELPLSHTHHNGASNTESPFSNREQRATFRANPEIFGIRKIRSGLVWERLIKIGNLVETMKSSPRRMTIMDLETSEALSSDLFGKFLFLPAFSERIQNMKGLNMQISCIRGALKQTHLWVDFSVEEWRIRLGEILWRDDRGRLSLAPGQQLWTNREILLLQILLACELLLRLDVIIDMDKHKLRAAGITPADIKNYWALRSLKVDWDLVLARNFLDNVLVVKRGAIDGWSGTNASDEPEYLLLPRNQRRQLSGLVAFANAIRWPELERVVEGMKEKFGILDTVPETAGRPSTTDERLAGLSMLESMTAHYTPLHRTFSTLTGTYLHRNGPDSGAETADLIVPLHRSGSWLSRSYLTGLIMPGEAICHLLICSLLENDPVALSAIGSRAHLYGGFIYAGRSWWSKFCILGRVLACLDGAAECMGWISLPNAPDLPSGWYDISSTTTWLPENKYPVNMEDEEDVVFRDSAHFPEGARPCDGRDLTVPIDSRTLPDSPIVFSDWGLEQKTPVVLKQTSDAETFTAALTFSDHWGRTVRFRLKHDVSFVTSYPCSAPSMSLPLAHSRRSMDTTGNSTTLAPRFWCRRSRHGVEFFDRFRLRHVGSLSSGPTADSSSEGDDRGTEEASPADFKPLRAHPLHVWYNYRVVPATAVLDPDFLDDLPESPDEYANPEYYCLDNQTILVLDARGSKDLELMARAWCASEACHALIGRTTRTCLACCIREASGLGIWVVIRV